jgi:hypothetical protein
MGTSYFSSGVELVYGKQLHVQTNAAIANAANKMLLGFSNGTGQSVYVTRVHCVNMQTSPITGVFTYLYLKRGSSPITNGTSGVTLTTITTPAIVPAMSDPAFSIPAGLTWTTFGDMNGTVTQLESARWTTDEVSPNGSGLAEMILAQGNHKDLWSSEDVPIVVPDGQALAVICDSTATNGQTLVDFNIRFAR